MTYGNTKGTMIRPDFDRRTTYRYAMVVGFLELPGRELAPSAMDETDACWRREAVSVPYNNLPSSTLQPALHRQLS
jgi:hypothetical protein